MKEISSRIDAIVRPVVEDMGYELILTELASDRGYLVVRLYIDQSPQGITIENCTQVSRRVSAVLDVEDPVPGRSYRLEVSSPGIDRPLVTKEHFQRFIGSEVRLRLTTEAEQYRKNYKGVIRNVSGENITIEIDKGETLDLRLCDVDKANLVGDLERHTAQADSASRK